MQRHGAFFLPYPENETNRGHGQTEDKEIEKNRADEPGARIEFGGDAAQQLHAADAAQLGARGNGMAAGTAFVVAFADDGGEAEKHESDDPVIRKEQDGAEDHEHELDPAAVAAGHASRDGAVVRQGQRF